MLTAATQTDQPAPLARARPNLPDRRAGGRRAEPRGARPPVCAPGCPRARPGARPVAPQLEQPRHRRLRGACRRRGAGLPGAVQPGLIGRRPARLPVRPARLCGAQGRPAMQRHNQLPALVRQQPLTPEILRAYLLAIPVQIQVSKNASILDKAVTAIAAAQLVPDPPTGACARRRQLCLSSQTPPGSVGPDTFHSSILPNLLGAMQSNITTQQSPRHRAARASEVL
jgi:hypothetical protein